MFISVALKVNAGLFVSIDTLHYKLGVSEISAKKCKQQRLNYNIISFILENLKTSKLCAKSEL